jgi:hypothetical protein
LSLFALVSCGRPDLVDTVIIDGRVVVRGRQLLVCDEREVIEGVITIAHELGHFLSTWHESSRGRWLRLLRE